MKTIALLLKTCCLLSVAYSPDHFSFILEPIIFSFVRAVPLALCIQASSLISADGHFTKAKKPEKSL